MISQDINLQYPLGYWHDISIKLGIEGEMPKDT